MESVLLSQCRLNRTQKNLAVIIFCHTKKKEKGLKKCMVYKQLPLWHWFYLLFWTFSSLSCDRMCWRWRHRKMSKRWQIEFCTDSPQSCYRSMTGCYCAMQRVVEMEEPDKPHYQQVDNQKRVIYLDMRLGLIGAAHFMPTEFSDNPRMLLSNILNWEGVWGNLKTCFRSDIFEFSNFHSLLTITIWEMLYSCILSNSHL